MGLTLNGENGIVYNNLNNDIKNLLMPKNWIINGMFDVWQRGTSQTTSGYGSDDRFLNANSVSTKTHSRQAFTIGQTEIPNNPTYFSRTVVTSGNTASANTFKAHWIEDVAKLAGKTVTLSFWAKADSNKNIAIEFRQYFGTGGSSMVGAIGVQKVALTSVWQKITKTVLLPSVVGKTIGSGSAMVAQIWFDAGSDFNARTNSLGNQSGTFDIANVSLVEGSVAVECQNQPYADVLRECRRYYQRFGGNTHQIFGIGMITGYDANKADMLITLDSPLRVTPTAIIYYGTIKVNDTNTIYNIASMSSSLSQTSPNSVSVSVILASPATTYRNVFLASVADANSFIAFDCEL